MSGGPKAAHRGTRAPALPALLLAVVLAGCSTTPHTRFYAQDGPPDSVPTDLAKVPDALPRAEPLHPYANRPYVALGRTYTPDTGEGPFHQRGIASWYGRQFHGNRTASGEAYDMFAMTAAHPTLPIPSYVRVTNVRDGRSVVVRVNDRGPFLHGRVIDLSFAAATRLGIASAGSGEVEVDRITPREIDAGTWSGARPTAIAATPGTGAVTTIAAAPVTAASAIVPAVATVPAPPTTASSPATAATAPVAPSDATGPWSIQLGAFSVAPNAAALRDRLALLLSAPDASYLPPHLRNPRVEHGANVDRVLIGHLPDRDAALHWAREVERFLKREAVVFRSANS